MANKTTHNDAHARGEAELTGVEALKQSDMMAHLLDSLQKKKDIQHYGRLVFAMVARHFLPEDELVKLLTRNPNFGEDEARALVEQVQGRDYNPPRRDRILEFQKEQDFPILPNPEDPDSGNVYRDLKFPDEVYEHIEEYRRQKAGAN